MRVSFVILWYAERRRGGGRDFVRIRSGRADSLRDATPGISVSDREFLLAHGIVPPSEPTTGGEEPVGEYW